MPEETASFEKIIGPCEAGEYYLQTAPGVYVLGSDGEPLPMTFQEVADRCFSGNYAHAVGADGAQITQSARPAAKRQRKANVRK